MAFGTAATAASDWHLKRAEPWSSLPSRVSVDVLWMGKKIKVNYTQTTTSPSSPLAIIFIEISLFACLLACQLQIARVHVRIA